MMLEARTAAPASDAELVERVRFGDTDAFGELWQRHYRPAYRAALQFARTIEPDDLISEAYLRVYEQLLAGRGPNSAFRPYLYSVIRNLALSRTTAPNLRPEPLYEDPEDHRVAPDPMIAALDRSLTSQAFRSLPDRWQMVLWYTEIEGMDPHEVAPFLGISANGVAALALRAREGLRQAWLQAHVNGEGTSADCQWAIARMGGYTRGNLGPRDRNRLEAHLSECMKCLLVSSEVEEVGSHLALVMIPLVLGGAAGIGWLETLSQPAMANLADAVLPSLPQVTETATHSDAAMLPLIGTFSMMLATGRRTRAIAIIGAVILIGSFALGLARTHEPVAPPVVPPIVTIP